MVDRQTDGQAGKQAGRQRGGGSSSIPCYCVSGGRGREKKKALVWEESFCLLAFLALLLQCLPGYVWNRRKAL